MKIQPCLVLMIFLSNSTLAQEMESTKPSAPNNQEVTLDATDILDKAEEFNTQKSNVENQIATLKNTDFSEATFEKLREKFETQQNLFIKKRLLSSWDLPRTSDFKNSTKELFSEAESLKNKYVDFLKKTDEIRKNLAEQKSLFKKYQEKIRNETDLEGQRKLLDQLISSIGDGSGQLRKIREESIKKYEPNIALMEKIGKFQNTIQNEIDYFKKERFHKTAAAFYENDFFPQFTMELLREISINAQLACKWDKKIIRQHITQLIPVLLLFIMLFFGFSKLQSSTGPDTKNLPILLSFAISWFTAPTLFREALPLEIILFYLGAALLFFLLLQRVPGGHDEQKDIRLLLVIYTLLSIIDVIGLPVPLYRMLISALGLSACYYCFRRLDKYAGSSCLFRVILQVLTALFFAATVAELLGYHLLAVLVINGSIKSAFLIFVLWHLRYYFLKIITHILNIEGLQQFKIIQKHRFLIYEKFQHMLHAALAFAVLLALSKFWGFHDSFGEAFEKIGNIGLQLENQKITLGMVFMAILAFYLVHLISFVTRHILEDEVYPLRNISAGAGKSINGLVYYLAWTISIFLGFSLLGFELKQFAIIAGALSVGIGFGLQNIVNNFISGLILLFERPIKVGDTLDIDGEWGTVEKVGLRSTIIRSASKTQLILPNSEFISKKVKNLTLSDPDYRVVIPVHVAYGSDVNLVKTLLLDIANKHPEIDHKTQPKIYFIGFGENALNLEIWFWTNNVNLKHDIISDFLFKIDEGFRKNGIEIPLPQRDLHIRSVGSGVLSALAKK